MARWCLDPAGTTDSLGTWKKFSIDGVDIKMFDQDDWAGTYGNRAYFIPDKPSALPGWGVFDEAQFRYYLACIENVSQQIYQYDIMYQLYKAGVCGQTLNLYDEDGNVIGYFKCGFYDSSEVMTSDTLAIIYTTAYYAQSNQTGEFSFTDYPAENPPSWAEACYRYKIVGPSSLTTTATHFRIDIHRDDISTQDITIVIGRSGYNTFPCWDIHFVNMYAEYTYVYQNSGHFTHYGSSTILTYHHGTNDDYICAGTVDSERIATNDNAGAINQLQNYNIYPTSHYHFKATGIAFIEIIPQEDGYVNELMNRFSPRYWAGSLGIYLIGTDDIADVMQAIMEVDVSDVLAQKFFGSDGKEYIMGLRWYYGLLQASGHTNGVIHMSADKMEVKVGTVRLDLDNVPIYEHIAASEFATWTSSELSVPAHFNNYLDFMSRYQLYIPYYGFLDIAANDIVGGTIQLIYNINLVTGVADIVVACKNSRTNNLKTKYYTVSAKIGIDIPYGSDMIKTKDVVWAQTCGKAFMTGATLGAGMAAAGAMENVSQANTALSNVNLDTAEGREAANNIVKNRDASQAQYNRAQFTKSILSDINVKSVDSPTRSGSTNDEAGSLDELHPYLLITRPVSVEPSDYETYVGVPSAASKKLSACSGFTQIAAVKPESLTNAPKYVNEIISLLQAGVYL